MKIKNLYQCLQTEVVALGLIAMVASVVCGCGQQSATVTAEAKVAALDAEVEPAERPYFDAARPFAEAVAARDYAKAYEYLSSHARARMSPSQFVAPADDATHDRNEKSVSLNAAPEQFARLMSATEKEYGRPAKLSELDVYSTGPVVLSGKATKMEDKLDAMFAIGMMPDAIPANIRKASLRSKLAVELSPEQLAESAKAQGMTPEQLKADSEFQPFITLKVVLVEEAGAYKVGYFEFLPPGIWD